jgi:hypothetical protein
MHINVGGGWPAETAFDINPQTVQYEEQLGSEAQTTAVLRGTWSGYTVAVKKRVGARASPEDLQELRAELKPLRYAGEAMTKKHKDDAQRGEGRDCGCGWC